MAAQSQDAMREKQNADTHFHVVVQNYRDDQKAYKRVHPRYVPLVREEENTPLGEHS
jgi:hypothetical protein